MRRLSMFQIILLCSFGALAIAGVLIFSLAVGGGGNSAIGPVAIWGTLDETAFQETLQQLADQNQDFLQVSYEQKDEETFIAELTNALASGTGPDLVILRDDDAYAQADRVTQIPFTSLSPEQFTTVFADAASPFLGTEGVIAIPFLIDPMVLYWNRDMLSSAGIAQPPAHWDELYDMSKKMTKRTELGTITKASVPFGQFRNYDNAKEMLATLMMQAGGSITMRNEIGELLSAVAPGTGATQATPAALRFYTEFADPAKDHYSWNASLPNARQVFSAGDLALYPGLASEKRLIARMNPNLNFSVAPMTQIRNGARSITGGNAYGLAIPRTSKNPTGALTVAYLLAGEEVSALFSTMIGLPSARRDVLAKSATGDLALFNKQALIVRSWIDPDPVRTTDLFRAMIEDTTSGAVLLGEAVQRADRQMGNIIGQ